MKSIVIKKVQRGDLKTLNKLLPVNIPNFHEDKIADQESGNSIWLIAWKEGLPVGHLQLRFNGAREKEIRKHIENCPHIESVGVKEGSRRQGIGTALVLKAEKLVQARGFKQAGMAVGATDNPDTKRLYEKLGFKQWQHGVFSSSWNVIKNGKTQKEIELCTYLVKNF